MEHYRKSLETRRELGDRYGISICLDHMGYVAREMGKQQEARQLHLESLAASREIGDPLGIAGSWTTWGWSPATRATTARLSSTLRKGSPCGARSAAPGTLPSHSVTWAMPRWGRGT